MMNRPTNRPTTDRRAQGSFASNKLMLFVDYRFILEKTHLKQGGIYANIGNFKITKRAIAFMASKN